MSQQAHQDSLSQAIEWRIRLRDNRSEDWEAFVEWLEGDPARSEAYDRVALADADVDPEAIPSRTSPKPANDEWDTAYSAPRTTRRRWLSAFAAVAALLIFGLIAMPWMTFGSSQYEVATAAGERKTIPIGDGGMVALNGATRIVLDHDNPRYAELTRGEATFTIRHDSGRPFLAVAGEHRIQDTGTVFNLVHDEERFAVEVVEGSVIYNPENEAIALAAGQTLRAPKGKHRLVVATRDPDELAGWRRGQLSYSEAPLATVASDLSRSLGTEILVDPVIAEQPFTGSIRVDGGDEATLARLASTLNLQTGRTTKGWLIKPLARANR